MRIKLSLSVLSALLLCTSLMAVGARKQVNCAKVCDTQYPDGIGEDPKDGSWGEILDKCKTSCEDCQKNEDRFFSIGVYRPMRSGGCILREHDKKK